MYQQIETYVNQPKEARQKHLDLASQCIEIGTKSGDCRALLAHHLRTTVPRGKMIHLCHGCHNGACSNVLHLYWGTASENLSDQYLHGKKRKNPHEIMRERMGEEAYREARREISRLGGLAKNKTPKQINESRQKFLSDFRAAVSTADTSRRGWMKSIKEQFGISHTHIRRLMNQLQLNT